MLIPDNSKNSTVVVVDPARTYNALAVFRDQVEPLRDPIMDLQSQVAVFKKRINKKIEDKKYSLPLGFVGFTEEILAFTDPDEDVLPSDFDDEVCTKTYAYPRSYATHRRNMEQKAKMYSVDAEWTLRRFGKHSSRQMLRRGDWLGGKIIEHPRMQSLYLTLNGIAKSYLGLHHQMPNAPQSPDGVIKIMNHLDEDIRLAKMAVAPYPIDRDAALQVAMLEDGSHLRKLNKYIDQMTAYVATFEAIETQLDADLIELEKLINEFKARQGLSAQRAEALRVHEERTRLLSPNVNVTPKPVVNPDAKYPPAWIIWCVMGLIVAAIVYFGFIKK